MVLASQFGRQEWKVESIPLESRFLWRVDSFGESVPLVVPLSILLILYG
jgi:hypothetical protein